MLYYMDYPYMFEIETTLKSKKGSRNNLNLVLTNSIASPSSKNIPTDLVKLNGIKVNKITRQEQDFVYEIKGSLSTDKLTIEIDKKTRIENMKNYLAYIILSLLFKKIYALDCKIVSFNEDVFKVIVPAAGLNNVERDLSDMEFTLNHIINSSLDVKVNQNKDSYTINIPSVGQGKIFYPVPSNTAELKLAIIKSFEKTDKGLEITFQTGDRAYNYLLLKNKEIIEIKNLINYEGENIVDEINFTKRSLEDLKDELYDLKTNVYKYYLDLINEDVYEIDGKKFLTHNIKEIFIKDLKLMIDSFDADFKFITNPKDENSEFILKNSLEEIDDLDLIKELQNIYPFNYEVKKQYIYGEIKDEYRERLKELIDRYIYSKLNK